MFFRKNKKIESPPILEKESPRTYKYFGDVVIVVDYDGRLSSELSKEGKEKLSLMNSKELLLYFSAIIDAHKLESLYNIYGTGPVSLSRDYLAFIVLTRSIIYLLQNKNG